MPQKKPRVIIMGGSIGGLTAALVLRKIGYEVDVFERSNGLLEGRGAGIISHPISLRYPTEFAAYHLDDLSIRPRWCRYLDDQGKVVSEQPCGFRVNSYGALYRALLRCVGLERYHLGSSVTAFQEAGSEVTVFLSNKEVRTADTTSVRGRHQLDRPKAHGAHGISGVCRLHCMERDCWAGKCYAKHI